MHWKLLEPPHALILKVIEECSELSTSPVWISCLFCTSLCCLAAYLVYITAPKESQFFGQDKIEDKQMGSALDDRPNINGGLQIQGGQKDERSSLGQIKENGEYNGIEQSLQNLPELTSTIPNLESPSLSSQKVASSQNLTNFGESEDAGTSSRNRPGSTSTTARTSQENHVAFSGPSFRAVNQYYLERGPVRADISDGRYHYVWDDSTEYDGEWVDGKANGRGTFCWPTGDRYEGEWEDGLENGAGAFIAVDGSTFKGQWCDGQMHGEGFFHSGKSGGEVDSEVTYMREYDRGKLLKEQKLRVQDKDFEKRRLRKNHTARKDEKRQALQDKAVPPRPGEVIYKGHRSYLLIKAFQTGLLFTLSQAGLMSKNPSSGDYKTTIRQILPRTGDVASFRWKDYNPLVFKRLRSIFGIVNDQDYMLSLTGDSKLRELPSPGKSSSIFFISEDDRFMIKTVRKEEMNLLLDLIPKYYKHCLQYPETLLTRFFGVHRIKPTGGNQVRFVVMANVFPIDTRLHRKFDLKGSTYGRTAGNSKNDPNATLKDLDVDFKLEVKKDLYTNLMSQLEADSVFLRRMNVMDYSLLLGMHYADRANSYNPVAGINGQHEENGVGERVEIDHNLEASSSPWENELRLAESDAARLSLESPRKINSRPNRHIGCPSQFPENLANPDVSYLETSENLGHPVSPSLMASQINTELEPSSRDSSLTSQDTSIFGSRPGSVFSRTSPSTNPGGENLRRRSRPWSTSTDTSSIPHSKFGSLIHSQSGRSLINDMRRAEHRNSPASTIDLNRLQDPGTNGLNNLGQRGVGNAIENSDRIAASVTRVEFMYDQDSPDMEPKFSHSEARPNAPLERTRSGWLKEGSGEGIQSLKGEPVKHMGCSVPALAFSLDEKGEVMKSLRPEPVTLFVGIIDFLQIYNMRKRGEHMFKSVVQDGKTISVTDPKTYANRFFKHMQGIFVPSE